MRSHSRWVERRDLFAEGVASGDPAPDSVLLWTRASAGGSAASVPLTVEVAEDRDFERVVATAPTVALLAADHTCRVLVSGLQPARTYWYRFTDENGHGSRIGRTRTAPADDDPRPARFAFVSCQNICEGAQNAYRRMLFEDERAAPENQLAFVLHLGDFVYEVVQYPEDVPGGHRYDRRLRDVIRYPEGEKIGDFRVPANLADYRALYRAYLRDPDLQDARAWLPFVPMWDNHEFSWRGWQSFQVFEGQTRPAQTIKVAANQAWFEYQPARVSHPGGSLERFDPPMVKNAPVERFDEQGLGQEPNNLAAIESLTAYRTLRWGRYLELLITDQRTYRSEVPDSREEAQPLTSDGFPNLIPQEILEVLDAGRTYANGKPPETVRYGEVQVPNFRKDEAPQTILGAKQKVWFLDRLRASNATWKVWGNSLGSLDWRADPQNLPPGLGTPWPGAGYACFGGGGDWGTAYTERGQIYDTVRDSGITGFVTVSGDRHSFWAGLAAKALPPAAFEPVGAAFITGSISAPGLVEAFEHRFPQDHPLRALYMCEVGGKKQPLVNLLMHHGVRACLEYQQSGDAERARRASNPDLAPHLSFLDMGGHGYATVHLTADAAECEFACIPRPLERSPGADGGPLRYRVVHRVPMWRPGERPRLERRVLEGDPELAL
ncbi:MAG TPA: alkaline phosphatase D family protein [Thermoanaerobaculia bacterium]|nr:alkaline phosphatase D family protein [Thermoanaerobaculia bacterium]